MESLQEPTKNLIKILRSADDVIDLSDKKWLYPVEILSIAALISEKKKKYKAPGHNDCKRYLQYFHFPNGLTVYQRSDKYIPIYNFVASNNDLKSIKTKTEIIQNLINIFNQKLGSPKGVLDSLNLAIDEIISNIEDHSNSQKGRIQGQYYEKKQFLDVCILDIGKTIYEKFKESKKEVANNVEAISKAMSGVSTKPEKIRGSGLPTFIKLIIRGFKGEFVLISGKALAFGKPDSNPIVYPISINWPGLILSMRIPKRNQPVDYREYID